MNSKLPRKKKTHNQTEREKGWQKQVSYNYAYKEFFFPSKSPSECNKLDDYVHMHIDIRCVLCASEWVSVFYGHMYEPERAAYAIFIWMWNEFCPCCFHKILVALHLHWPTEPVDLWFFDWQNSNTKRNLRNYWYLICVDLMAKYVPTSDRLREMCK